MTRFGKAISSVDDSLDAVRAEVGRLQAERRTLEDRLSGINVEIESLTRSANLAASKALRRAALHGDFNELQQHIAAVVNINTRNRSGATALLLAAYRDGNERAIRALLEAGADPNKADFEGNTPLTVAVRPGQLDMVRALIEHGALVNARNRDGDSPLTNAATWGSDDIVQYLLKHGADSAMVDGMGLTASQLAREQGHIAIAASIESARQTP